jgi:SAM-dependent methyltransferase
VRAIDAAANVAAWQTWAASRIAGDTGPGVLPARLEWTQVPSLGPGEELLGDLDGRTVLELGCGAGDTTAYLASRGATAVGVDDAPAQIERARNRWGHIAGAVYVRAEAAVYLTRPGQSVDVIVSVFGALDFAAPDVLLPLIAARLRPGGRLAFSTIHPAQRAHLPLDRLRIDGGASVPVSRPLPAPAWWPTALAGCGLAIDLQLPVTALGDDAPRCLITTATKREP